MSKKNYEKTPSFYNSQEVFEKYLGQSSYYTTLQENVIKLCKLSGCKSILELGCATGATSISLAKALPASKIVGLDMRNDIIDVAKQQSKLEVLPNLSFEVSNFCDYKKYHCFNFIVMLYSFHHIEDPEENKFQFLKDVYSQAENGTFLCVAETFLNCDLTDDDFIDKTRKLWDLRVVEGKASTFWSALKGLKKEEINFAIEVGQFCGEYEGIAGNEVVERKTEFLLSKEKLCEMAKKIGWKIIICEDCNAVGESIVLLQK